MKLWPPILLAFNSVTAAFAAGPVNGTALPKNWGVALYRSFDSIDYLAFSLQPNLALIAPSLSQVWVKPVDPALNKQDLSFWFSVNPTHTYADPPKDIEVLLVPGGPGSRMGNIDEVIAFVKKTYPGLKYLMYWGRDRSQSWSIGRQKSHDEQKGLENSYRDGSGCEVGITSEVTSGPDLIFAFIEEVYGATYARDSQGTIELNRVKDACDDSFAEEHQVPPSGDCSQS
ncbi:hypothetical protein CEK26_012237 [Fusarium fujikuroi]|uniref:Uncharacterized protein n=1 Tax=Fusarium fujikuroi TaxID=5127 RepID=A0A5Q3F2B3_FUSFU|nr:hypothetical protein CEK27_012249 [Fusarium fujikuroi]QGI85493.1 hypothetical protein CEK25_012222 [Fusarium fujikuroi]QGI99168.1 hypothetical protein CEK26_012237 [Fusarium fujikuroi]VTT64939.1 unnamed protein product [Fusarium fujikuroi]VTT78820.1 unnamed protein product [Fusarium fujikuroi]